MMRRCPRLLCASTLSSTSRITWQAGPIFDACFLLNLDRRPDRLQHAMREIKQARIEQLLRKGQTVERVSGVDGQSLAVDDLVAKNLITPEGRQRLQLPLEQKLFGMDLTLGAIGCALGHRKIWEIVRNRKLQCALVLEDDVEFSRKFKREFPARWANVPSDWGIVYLGGLDLLSRGKPPRPFVAEGVRLAYHGHRELTAYAIHAKAAQRCLELSAPMTWQVDTHICSQLQHDPSAQDEYIADPKSYVLQPSLVIQLTKFGTDVQKCNAENSDLEDASRRMREFVGGGTSVR